MRLLDLVAQTVSPICVSLPNDRLVRLPGADAAARELAHCATRYVLDDEVAALCTQTAFEHESVMGDCMDILRLPAAQLWLEFDNLGRASVLARAGVMGAATGNQRIGMMMTSDGGRQGTIRFAWQGTAAPGAEAAAVSAEFDLDDPAFAQSGDNDESFGVMLENMPGLGPLFDRIRFRVDPDWRAYYRQVTVGPAQYQRVLQQVISPLCGDLPLLFSFMLLMMTRSALQTRPTDLSRLNRSRAKTGRIALLDHVEVGLDLTAHPMQVANDHGGESTRAQSRLHLVRGHLVRRGDSVFWRSAHMRGSADLGTVTSRTVTLRLAAAR